MITNGMRVVVIAVLGRVLTSTDFGIVAAAVSVNVIVFGVRDLGIGLALVQRKELLPGHLTTAFAASTYLGLALSGALFAAAPLIGESYGITESIGVIRGLAVMFAFRSVATTSRMLCQRAMAFRLIALVEAVAFTTGSIVSMACAIAGMGPWALVTGYLVEEVIGTVLFLYHQPPVVSFRINRARLTELLGFGAGHSFAQIANLIATFGDNVIVGRQLGARALGYYSRAYDLIKFPSMVFDAIVGNVLFPAFSKLQGDRGTLANSFCRVMFVNALVLLPASAALIILAPEAIRLMMGGGWEDAILPFQILAVAILLRTSMKLGAIVAQAAGSVNWIAIAYSIYALILVGGAAFTIRWGIAGVATSTTISIAISSFMCCYLAMRVSSLSVARFVGAHVPGLVLAAAVTVVAWPLTHVLRDRGAPNAVTFGVVGVTSVVLCLAAVALWIRGGRGEFGWLGAELRRVRARRASVTKEAPP